MTIEIFSHDELHPLVDIEQFEQELKDIIQYERYKQNVKVFFINNPRIKGLVNTDIDLLLIIALENKDRCFYKLKNYSAISNNEIENNNFPRDIYFNNLIIPIKFIDYLENVQKPEIDGKINFLYTDKYEENIGQYTKELFFQTKKYLESIWKEHQLKLIDKDGSLTKFNIFPNPIVWVISPNHAQYDFTRPNFIYAYKFGFKELDAYFRFSPLLSNSFTSNYHWSKERNNHEAYNIIDTHIDLLKEQIEKDNKIGSLTKKKIDRINKQYAEDLDIYNRFLLERKEEINDHIEDDFFLSSDTNLKKKKIMNLPERVRAKNELNKNLIIISGKAGSGKTFEMMSLIKKSYEESKKGDCNGVSGYYLTYNKLLANDVKIIRDNY